VGKPPHRPACGTKLEPGKGAAHRDDPGVTAGVGAGTDIDIADAIDDAFDALLMTSRVGMDLDDHGWGKRAREADFRVINGTGCRRD